MDENQLKGLGYDRFMRKHSWVFYGGSFIAFIALLLFYRYLPDLQMLAFVPAFALFVGWLYFASRESIKVLNFVKGKEEPVDLDELLR
jgi:hypothetical protein